ncbi:MAG TPA: glycosyltransferase family 2 protein [Fimbriimonadaceae bacterium]|nr:glycosyltransferase family 2 protein [Fimbriimonadaceae bacterium]
MAQPGVSVVVVSYNTLPQLRRCLAAIEPEHEIIVIDNASTDGSPDMVAGDFPHARLVRNERNEGFGKANNQGIDLATRELVLFLNSDCYASPGAISALARIFFDQRQWPHVGQDGDGMPHVVAAGGRLLNLDGTLQESVAGPLDLRSVFFEQTMLERLLAPKGRGYWRTQPLLRIWEFQQEQENASRQAGLLAEEAHSFNQAFPATQVMGACLMIRPLERFDERFFLYCEDTDLCKRLRRHGMIVYVPAAVFTHELGSSSAPERWRSVALYNRGKELYFSIHHGPLHAGVCWLLDRLGALLRLIVWSLPALVSRRARSKVALFARVLFAPLRGPARG